VVERGREAAVVFSLLDMEVEVDGDTEIASRLLIARRRSASMTAWEIVAVGFFLDISSPYPSLRYGAFAAIGDLQNACGRSIYQRLTRFDLNNRWNQLRWVITFLSSVGWLGGGNVLNC